MVENDSIYYKLHSLPKVALLERLLDRLGDTRLLEILSSRLGEEVQLSELHGKLVSKALLIEIASLGSLSAEDVNYLNEEYRYRGMKTIYLHQLASFPQENMDAFLAATEDELTRQLAESDIAELDYYEDLRIKNIEEFSIEGSTLYEVLYSYVTRIQTLDPETEEPVAHPDLRYGFVWINWDAKWAAVSAKDADILAALIKFLETYLDTMIAPITIPKEVINLVEGWDNIRRTSHEDDKGIRRRIMGSNLGSYTDEISQLRDRDQKQRRTSSGYNAELDDGTELVVGYNGEKGSFYFSKNLRTSHLRQFGVAKILALFRALEDCWRETPQVMLKLTIDGLVNGNKEQKVLISELVSSLAALRLHPETNTTSLNIDVMKIAQIDRYFQFAALVDCDECGDGTEIICQNCEGISFTPSSDGIKCKKCGTNVTSEVLCSQGHPIRLSSFNDVVSLYPKSSLYDVVEDIYKRHKQIPFNRYEESFFLRGSTLHLSGRVGEKTVYMMHDIPELAEAASIQLMPPQNQEILSVLNGNSKGGYQEKCRQMNHANCSVCVDKRVSPHCLMRLFGLYDTTYIPRPHQGHEFGDVSLHVTLDGRPNQVMLILLKKGNPSGRPITKLNELGSEIYAQFDEFVDNPTAHLIAVAVPQRIEEGFKARLQNRASSSGKKILFMEAEELAKIIQYVSQSYDISLADL